MRCRDLPVLEESRDLRCRDDLPERNWSIFEAILRANARDVSVTADDTEDDIEYEAELTD